MKRSLVSLAALSLVVVGCQEKKTASVPVGSSSVLEVQPLGNPQPAPQPVISDGPTYTSTPAPVANHEPVPAAAVGQRSYTIKKGDTLYGIAVAHYGDGKQWTRIADANPGINPSKLMVGKSIVIP